MAWWQSFGQFHNISKLTSTRSGIYRKATSRNQHSKELAMAFILINTGPFNEVEPLGTHLLDGRQLMFPPACTYITPSNSGMYAMAHYKHRTHLILKTLLAFVHNFSLPLERQYIFTQWCFYLACSTNSSVSMQLITVFLPAPGGHFLVYERCVLQEQLSQKLSTKT